MNAAALQDERALNHKILGGEMGKVLSTRKTLVHILCVTLISVAMNFVLEMPSAHSFSLFEPGSLLGPSLVGTWEDTDSWILNVNLVLQNDGEGRFGIVKLKYTVSGGVIKITTFDIWGQSTDSKHKATIEKDRLTLEPPLLFISHFKRIK